MAPETTTDDGTDDELPRTLDDFPGVIEGGDYDGAVLIGVLDGDLAEYYDETLDKVVSFRLLADRIPDLDIDSQTGRDLRWEGEEPLGEMTITEHIEETEAAFADYDELAETHR